MHFFLRLGLNLIKMSNLTLFVSTIVFTFFCTVTIYLIEPTTFNSLLNAFYFVLTTFTTVGYGDFSPVTTAGKLFSIFMYLFGIGLVGIVLGKIIDELYQSRSHHYYRLE
ncbi:potassium channel family protein [Ornithinibacillus halophilus]|uniref:Voltage-gated potassium channel n=1 Tax=Ornithinibacillus halophilus TaxID=930117 RepID=A0A1M5IIE1_9BACI|nr:potassium channel family protein [Ornithinibacillus halophilus]SHG27819.1 voltage-gated potassium channel [Ornithinibacillus halophilus]